MERSEQSCRFCDVSLEPTVRQGAFQYWSCAKCHTAHMLPQPSEEFLERFYAEFHERHGAYSDFEDRMSLDFPAKTRLCRRLAGEGDARLLDVGCGKGYFLKEAQRAGFRAEGIDVSSSAIDFATDQLHVTAHLGIMSEDVREQWRGKFDVVTLWATIEHVPNPRPLLLGILACLKDGGVLILDTGLGAAPWESVLAGYSQWFDAPQHLFVYSEQTLVGLLRDAGFSVERVDRNFERSLLRRLVKHARHAVVCVVSFALLRPGLGKTGFLRMRCETKWPIGRLISIIARKPPASKR